MRIITTITMLALGAMAFAQQYAELVIFSNNGEPFYVVMNGVYQNYEPSTNVRVQSLTDEFYNTRILCPNNTFEIQKNITVKRNYITTYRVIEKDGEYKLRYYSESPLNTYQPEPAYGQQSIIVFHATGDVPPPVSQTTTTTTMSSTTTSGNPAGGENVNINIQVGENGMNAGVYTNTGMTGGTTTTTYSESTTVTTTTSGSGYVQGEYYEEDHHDHETHNHYDPYSSCALDNAGFERLKASIQAESFSDDRLRVANQAARNKCMTVSQIKDIARLFSFSGEQLEFTKAAYNRCQNRSDYYEVLEIFTFSSDKEALEEYINSH